LAISLETSASVLAKDDKAQLSQLISEVETIKDQMSKVALVLKHLSESVAEQRSKSEPQSSETVSMLQTMKVHVDSFPHALREARRSDVATQRAVENLAARVMELEQKLGTNCTTSKSAAETA
jgi:hypothetical protein